MDAEGTASVNQIAGWQSDNLTTLDTALDSMVYLKMDDEEILNYEAQFLGTYEDFPNGVYLSYDDGKVPDTTSERISMLTSAAATAPLPFNFST